MGVSLDLQKPQGYVPVAYYDAVVVGAGPYGLSTAAHLLGYGLKVAIFGKPLSLWHDNMPKGMFLRSYWWASNLSDPQKKYRMADYFRLHDLRALYPLPRETFIDYGLWFQKHAVPDVDETYVDNVQYQNDQFELRLVDGRIVRSRTVVMAPGLYYYTYLPPEYDHLPPELVSHTSGHSSFDCFAGKSVIVVGGGQSALESAAILNESGAKVNVISRSPIHWLTDEEVENRRLLQRIRYPKAGIAPGWFNWILENVPYAFQQLPRRTKDDLLRGPGSYGPAGSGWLKPRVIGHVKLHEGQTVREAKEADDGVRLTLANGEVLKADALILATGYRVNVWKLPMLHASVVSRIRTYQNAPVLNNRFESSVPGLYFVGISALSSFGPLYRFVVGTEAAARQLASAVARQAASSKWRVLHA